VFLSKRLIIAAQADAAPRRDLLKAEAALLAAHDTYSFTHITSYKEAGAVMAPAYQRRCNNLP
jgi:hypothetical protein